MRLNEGAECLFWYDNVDSSSSGSSSSSQASFLVCFDMITNTLVVKH